MGWLRRSADSEPLPVTMTGVKLGDRFLAIGAADPPLIAALAIKAGLTGEAAVVEADEERARRGAAAIERAGALAQVTRAPWSMFPYDSGRFDVALVRDLLASLRPDARPRCISEALRVLRPGGRLVVIEPAPRGGIGALLHRQPAPLASAELVALLQAAGFAAVRILADRDGIQYVEGIKHSRIGDC